MKKWVVLAGVAWLAFVAGGLVFLVARPRQVASAELKSLYLVFAESDGQALIRGAFGPGTRLARAEHRIEGDAVRLRIYGQPAFKQPSSFEIRLPKGIAQVIVVNPDHTETDLGTLVRDYDGPIGAGSALQMESLSRE